ncbi:motility associated factor glycosyltransferase family protein [Shewanella mangrovisoli]|uniref:Motility associated factor glycosyltransferase family protein n=1 Tax=Shewanella mangrovisoli TaxID=2864211 RepID=A0ABV4VG56_9GAMM
MTNLFTSNIAIIEARWPKVASAIKNQSIAHLDAHLVQGKNQTISVDGIQLSSRHDRMAEVQLNISQLPLQSHSVYLYGLGLGDLPRELLLHYPLEKLTVTLLNLAVTRLVLSYTDQTDWLSSPKCELELAKLKTSFLTPFITSSAELVLADDDAASLRNKILIHYQTRFAARAHQAEDPQILERFKQNEQLIQEDSDISELYSNPCEHIIVIGTGPSLEASMPQLKRITESNKRPLIIAVDTALKPLLKEGIKPDIVVSIDADINAVHLLPEASKGIKLVYFPRLAKETLMSWQGKRFVAYGKQRLYDSLRKVKHHDTLYTGGSVLHTSVDLAVKMLAKHVYLIGCDLSFPNNKTHTGWADGELNMHISAQASHQWVLNNREEKVTTSLSFISYIDALESYIKIHPETHFYTTSELGAKIEGCAYLALDNLGSKL